MGQAAQLAGELTTEEMTEVLRIFTAAIEAIQQQGEGDVAPISAGPPEIPAGQYPSSNVEGFKFDPKTKELLIQYHGKFPNAKGPIYAYSQIPEFIYKILERGAVGPRTSGANRYHAWHRGVTPSYGAAVNALIKSGGYNFTRLS